MTRCAGWTAARFIWLVSVPSATHCGLTHTHRAGQDLHPTAQRGFRANDVVEDSCLFEAQGGCLIWLELRDFLKGSYPVGESALAGAIVLRHIGHFELHAELPVIDRNHFFRPVGPDAVDDPLIIDAQRLDPDRPRANR